MHKRELLRCLAAVLLLATACFATVASAEIFRCVARNGLPLYQNFPCEFDSLGAMGPLASTVVPDAASAFHPSTPAPMSGTPEWRTGRSNDATNVATRPTDVQPVPFDVTVAVRMASESEPRVGMTHDEVRTLLGEPVQIIQDEPLERGPAQTWRYTDRSIQFDSNRRVVNVQTF